MLENEIAQRYHDVSNRRDVLQSAHRKAWDAVARRRAVLAAFPTLALPAMTLLPASAPALIGGMAMAITTLMAWAGVGSARATGRKPVFVVAAGPGNDSGRVVDKLHRLMEDLRRDDIAASTVQKHYDEAMDAIQTLVPQTPLAHLERDGYYPDWPTRTDDEGDEYQYKLDDDPVEDHWKRVVQASDALGELLKSPGILTMKKVHTAVAELIPPLRAVLRAAGVRTHRIEFLAIRAVARGAERSASLPAPERTAGRAVPAVIDTTASEMRHKDLDDSLLSGVRDRLNASATMTAAMIDTLATSFRAAEPALFAGDDRTTGELLLERHLPQLERAFVVADDASSGEERDAVRAQFARSLATMREQLDGIMERHAAAARDMLRDQARFIDERHGREPLQAV